MSSCVTERGKMKIFSIQNYNANQQSKASFQGGFTSVGQVRKMPANAFLNVLAARGVRMKDAETALSTDRSLSTAIQNSQKYLKKRIGLKRRHHEALTEAIAAKEHAKGFTPMSKLGTAEEKGATGPINMTEIDFQG